VKVGGEIFCRLALTVLTTLAIPFIRMTEKGIIASGKTILWGLHLERGKESVTLIRLLFQYPDGYLGLFLKELLL